MAINFNNICRLCMAKKEALLPLFKHKKGEVISLPTKIMNFVPVIKVYSGDGLPAQVCRPCIRLLNTSYKFKQQCENSDTALREYLDNQQVQETSSPVSENDNDFWKITVKSEFAESESTFLDDAPTNDSDDDQRVSDEAASLEENEWTSPKAGPSSIETRTITKKPKKTVSSKKFSKERKTSKKWSSYNEPDGSEVKIEEEKIAVNEVSGDIAQPVDGKDFSDFVNSVKVEPFIQIEVKTPKVKEKKSFLCHDCGKNFARKQHLLLHLRTHTGEKPFMCKVCGESFGMSSNLNKHMRIHTGERPFLCTMCGKCFGRSDTLTKHMRCHTGEKPFHCNVCGNNFGRSSTLINHMRTHLGEKPYLCTECGRRFVQSYDLTKHMRSHTGEKPYSCTVCRMSFGQKNSLNKHMRSHASDAFASLEFQRTVPCVHYRPAVTDLSIERNVLLIGAASQIQ